MSERRDRDRKKRSRRRSRSRSRSPSSRRHKKSSSKHDSKKDSKDKRSRSRSKKRKSGKSVTIAVDPAAEAAREAREAEEHKLYLQRVASQVAKISSSNNEDNIGMTAEERRAQKRLERQRLVEQYQREHGKPPVKKPKAQPPAVVQQPAEPAFKAPVAPASTATQAKEAAAPVVVADLRVLELADDEDDIFAATPPPPEKRPFNPAVTSTQQEQEIQTDVEGYSSITAGTILNSRYKVTGEAGKGVFSVVVHAIDLQQNGVKVVVKITRLNEAMKRAGRKEIEYLQELTNSDPNSKYCTLRLIDHFEDREFLCVVLEALDISLRQVIYQYGKGIGLNIGAVQYYARKILLGLHHLRKNGIVHTDLKLDNLLVDESRSVIKIADFGSARRINELRSAKHMQELCPLWYRPPEVLVGYPFLSYSVDMWMLGNTLFELATGTVLLRGNSPTDMLQRITKLKGPLPKQMVQSGEHGHMYYANHDPTRILEHSVDPADEEKVLARIVQVGQEPGESLKERLFAFFNSGTKKVVMLLFDLINRMLTLNPRKRITVEEALKHPFFQLKLNK